MLAQWETALRQLGIALHLHVAVFLERIIGRSIQRVLDVHAKALVLGKVRVGQQRGPLALREVALQHRQTTVGLRGTTLSRKEQEQVVPHVIVMLVVGIVPRQSRQVFLAQRQVVQLVFDDDTGVIQAVLDDIMTGGQLFLRKGNLRQIVFAVVGVEGGTIHGLGISTAGDGIASHRTIVL